jgi:YidC/Oxa1 family membrane protein insertase
MYWNLLVLDPMINALLKIYEVLGQQWGLAGAFGLAIIVFTILIRLVTLPLTIRSQQSMQKMQALQQDERFLKLQKKYKDNRQKLQEEQMKLYQEMGINPLSGCLPQLIQLPIIFGLYGAIIRALADAPAQLLEFSQHIYSGISAAIIPLDSRFLWMDLAQPERLRLGFLSGLPVLSDGIPVLAIVVVITTYLQTKLTTPTAPTTQGSGMTQALNIYMPLLLGYFAYSLASGLALYFFVSNLLGILQAAAMKPDALRERIAGLRARIRRAG